MGEKIKKKELKKLLYKKLENALAEFKNHQSDKKFSSNLKKASKLFIADMLKGKHVRKTTKLNSEGLVEPLTNGLQAPVQQELVES
jgi:hypothetical protein